MARAIHGADPNLMADNGGWGLLSCCCAAAVFLAVETVLFHGSAYLNDADDEVWLRRTLASRSFYVIEAAVLLMGALSAAVWTAGAWFMLLLVPVYVLAQQAALQRAAATAGGDRRARPDCCASSRGARSRSPSSGAASCKGRAWSVAFADLDHFKGYNDTHGHLAGDAALAARRRRARAEQLRCRDLVGRFGGEEFCVFLPDTAAAEAAAGRRAAAPGGRRPASCPGPAARATVSIGVVTVGPGSTAWSSSTR